MEQFEADIAAVEKRLRSKGYWCAALAAATIVMLSIYGLPAKNWAATLEVIANAVTISAAVWIPVTLVAAARDLIRWIAYQFTKWRRDAERAVVRAAPARMHEAPREKPSQTATTPPPLRPSVSGGQRAATASGAPLRVASMSRAHRDYTEWGLRLVFALAALLLIVSGLTVRPVAQQPPQVHVAKPPAPPDPPKGPCPVEDGAYVCTASATLNTAEAMGIAVCGKAGEGRRIHAENGGLRHYSFSEREMPIGTKMTVTCR